MKKIILLSALSLFVSTLSFADTNNATTKPVSAIIGYREINPDHLTASIFDPILQRILTEMSDKIDDSNRQAVTKDAKELGRTFKIAKVHRSEGKLLLTVGRYSKGYTMKIQDHNGRTLYREHQLIDNDFAQVYDISSIKGEFVVTVADENGNKEKFEF